MGKGCVFTVADGTINIDPDLLEHQINVAQKNNIKFQIKTPKYGGTNAGNIHVASLGVKTIITSVPVRYLHGPFSIVSMDDLVECNKFLELIIDSF
jgi:tetrahedral aminopeptidase